MAIHSSSFTTERDGQTADSYSPPDLFPDAHRYGNNRADLHAYVREVLLDLAAVGKLSVTDLHNQSAQCSEAAGMCVLGQRFDEQSKAMVLDTPCPEELARYKVKVRAIRGAPIKYKIGREPRGAALGVARESSQSSTSARREEDVWAVSDAKELEVNLPEAWRILHQAGAYCRPARREGLRKKLWLYEEVRPVPKKKPGRPKKGAFERK